MSREEENTTLYVVGVPECADETRIREEFGKYGKVEIVTILAKRDQYKTHTVFVKYSTFEEAKRAKNQLNCTNPFDNGPTMSVKIADKDHKRKARDDERRRSERDREWERERRRGGIKGIDRRGNIFSKRESSRFDNRRGEYNGYDKFLEEKERRYAPYQYNSVLPSYNSYSMSSQYHPYTPIASGIVPQPKNYGGEYTSTYVPSVSYQPQTIYQPPQTSQGNLTQPTQYNYNPYKK
ncbi:RNA recognition motif domain containing protein [Entamoeba histolytica HM-1:IMSS-B]|uniref:RNA recognition motif domain containing protein n=6 Tax=Entamoeba histolytica TaxID=5759 RepID=C4M2R4_ENTH1|nr:RNA recognition motif domain containing protein [Entamoeba histolytica HM-1:IMSS]EMD45995.1 RNA recognition domain containing protein [Entamoeba histolytica KU27]EMH74035.1 RNA recognition motif domain containing protein [Entamoeba histolytica HM-1:IMSS-B]EMS15093.1 RNA recognition motif domain containing protein [Entamoeba histolytica HM-3:IMSS]ENY64088.1 RNA recognition motif domain containing protein [Entamoeba histolytica HM-1:IMSS-A]GAT95575.1 RNA recognition motif domain containing pr|eukprot:XP_649238.1 RNA recognition motif domain containing protein [Entamoeba histolytica HM-1:IMSS]